MELIGTDSNFRAQTKLCPVIKTSARIDHYCGTIDASRELPRPLKVSRYDRVGMSRAILINVSNRGVQGVDDAARNDRSAPSLINRSSLLWLLAQAITFAPTIFASNTQAVPTPPLAPSTNTVSSAVTLAFVCIILLAVA